ncbi:MAG: hypothetical protein C0451_04960 [Comamonadaceae bacterium]|nr:hypothetical protein [Comamonadaceae bacterium]
MTPTPTPTGPTPVPTPRLTPLLLAPTPMVTGPTGMPTPTPTELQPASNRPAPSTSPAAQQRAAREGKKGIGVFGRAMVISR